jgi:hypothetical protein
VALPTIREQGLTGPTVALVIAWIAVADAVAALLGDALITAAASLIIALGRRYFGTGLAQAA